VAVSAKICPQLRTFMTQDALRHIQNGGRLPNCENSIKQKDNKTLRVADKISTEIN